MMKKDFAPGMADMVRSQEVKTAIGETAREVARQAVLGSNEGLAELAEKRKREQGGSPTGAFILFFTEHAWFAVLVGCVIAFGVPLLLLLRGRSRATKFRLEAERRNARAEALLEAMEAEGRWSSNLLSLLRENLLDADPDAPPRSEPSRPRSGTPRRRGQGGRLEPAPHSR
jgi:hypothetical protein